LGLSWGSKDNGTAFSSIWETLPTPQFGLWLARRNETSANGGSLTLGGFDTDVIHGEIDWIDTAPGKIGAVSSGWWIPIEGITYSTNSNGTAIGDTITIENTTAMVDSGSTYSYGSHEILDKLYLSIPGVKKYQSHNYYGYSANPEIAQNLSMSLHFNGREYKIDKDDLFRCGQIKGSCISTFLSDGRKEATWIIGANFMKNVYTAFRGSPPAVGFASLKTNAISDSAVNSTTSSRTLQPDETEQSSTPQPDETEQSEEVSTPSASGAALAAKQDNSAARLVASSKSLSQLFASFLVVVTMFDLF
jgi:cathepsin D